MGHLSTLKPAPNSQASDEMRLLEIEAFVRRHTLSLHTLAGTLAGETAEALVERLVERVSAGKADLGEVADVLVALRDLLASASFASIDALARRGVGPKSLDGAVRWFGARLSDLVATRAM